MPARSTTSVTDASIIALTADTNAGSWRSVVASAKRASCKHTSAVEQAVSTVNAAPRRPSA